MNISNDTAAINYIDYFTKQLPADLAAMAALRDELAVRQGALSAAQDTIALKEAAITALTDAKAQVDTMKTKASDTLAKAEAIKTTQDARQTALDVAEADFNAKFAAFDKASLVREKDVSTRETNAAAQDAKLKQQAEDLANGQAALDDRVKAFQAKVAALSA